MKKFFLLTSFIVCLFSYSNLMATEEPPYDIVHKNDIYEVRNYSDRLVVQVLNKGDNNSFRKLFNYISGQNKNSEKIAMTIPVTQTKENGEQYMQFYLPSKFNKETMPIPTNPDIEIATIQEGYYAVIRYSGNARDKNFDRHAQILRTSLIEDKVEILGPSIKAIYNGPFTLPIMRRNEAMFKVEWKKL